MITQAQIDSLKGGEKLIFVHDGGVLSSKVGHVFTFANWWKEDDARRPGKYFWQCHEIHDQVNHVHNFSIYHTEIFNEKIHHQFVIIKITT